MTVSYTREVASCKGFGCFLKLLVRWRASIYKLIWVDFLVFISVYYALSFVYLFALNPDQKHAFESIVIYCNRNSSLIPLSFVLGFYVVIVVRRWWSQYMSMPWPDAIAVYVSAIVRGQDERGRVMRRTVMRYVCLTMVMVFSMISPSVKKRFPTLDHLVDSGLLMDSEKEVIQDMDDKFPKLPKHWMPIVWAASIITRARKEGRIRDDNSLKTIIDELNIFRGKCGLLLNYDMICIPLVYTQVVTLATYSYLFGSIVGHQWIEGKEGEGLLNVLEYYFPFFTTLEFFFFLGWLKVAESLICPFGDDDDDYETNWVIDRNVQASYLIVDEMHHEHPELIKDQYWDEVFPEKLPYTRDAAQEEPPEPSTAKLEFPGMSVLQMVSVSGTERQESTLQLFKRQHSFKFTPSTSFTIAEEEQYKSSDEMDESEGGRVINTESAIHKKRLKRPGSKQKGGEGSASTQSLLTTDNERDYFEELRRQRQEQRSQRRQQRLENAVTLPMAVQRALPTRPTEATVKSDKKRGSSESEYNVESSTSLQTQESSNLESLDSPVASGSSAGAQADKKINKKKSRHRNRKKKDRAKVT